MKRLLVLVLAAGVLAGCGHYSGYYPPGPQPSAPPPPPPAPGPGAAMT